MKETARFVDRIRERTFELMACCPGCDVFSVTKVKLLECIAKMDFQATAEPEHIVVANLQEELAQLETEESYWALAFIDLWNCSHFHGQWWGRLVKVNRANIKFPIQAAYYIWRSSGKDHLEDLANFVGKTGSRTEARAYLNTLGLDEDLRRWATLLFEHG